MSTPIIKIKVDSGQIKNFPFDIFYIVSEDNKTLLPQLFPYSLCIPINEDLERRVRALYGRKIVRIGSDSRTEEACTADDLRAAIDKVDFRQAYMVVPVLGTVHKKTRNKRKKDKNPAYLIAKQHRHDRGVTGSLPLQELREFFNDFTVLFTPRGAVRPICGACPRHLEHIQGKCTLGETKCYESLVVSVAKGDLDEQL